MSGSEASDAQWNSQYDEVANRKPDFESLGLSEADLAEFAKTGPAQDIDKLRRAGRFREQTTYRNARTGNSRIERGNYIGEGYTTNTGEDVSQLLAQFNAWKDRRAATNKQYEEYLRAKKERPGRAATILTNLSGNEASTLIGSPMNPAKTLIGGLA